ncbi:MAG: double-strand break repair protein AddB, partial [Gluconacetobacter diazotrophicus]|nr:double-strand break repair protein AddB [Gluconacetobacter diazotrophicus]
APGFAGLRRAVNAAADAAGGTERPEEAWWNGLRAFLDRVEAVLAPLRASFERDAVPPTGLVQALIAAGEALCATEDEPDGAAILWSGEEGNALAEHLAALGDGCDGVPPQPPVSLGGLLDASMAGLAVRGRRALRGLPPDAAEHPRLFIWGLLEARLQSADLLVLGGLVEGVWPPSPDPGPWMSRPMRMAVGLPSPEEAVGQAAHDFLSACCGAPEVVLSCPGRRDGAPAVPARWLVRLDAFLQGRNQCLPAHPAGEWLRRLDQPAGAAVPVRPPSPRPPVRLRPRRLSVTEIETWMRDPYAVHARHVLGLKPLAELEQPADAADYGTIVHEALASFFAAHPGEWPADAAALLADAFDRALDARQLRPALAAWWRPRLGRIAGWVAEVEEARRRDGGTPAVLKPEVYGRATLDAPGGSFTLSGRADRIDRRADGKLALFDYKTGTLPNDAAVRDGWASQLVLEAAMAAAGAFGPELRAAAGEINYWRLSGGHEPGSARTPVADDELAELVARCWERLEALVAAYDDPQQPYLSHPRPGRAPPYPDYAQLARVAEWSAAREEG